MPSMLQTLLLAISATQVAAFCAHGTSLSPRAAGVVPVATFGYAGATGPANWHSLNITANAACATGRNQSPIDLVDGVSTDAPGSQFAITIPDFANGAVFENLGSTVEIVGQGGHMTIPGSAKVFNFAQFHFHLPSEHLDNGTAMAMEVHMVFQAADAELAVLGTYIDVTTNIFEVSNLLEDVFQSVGAIATPGTATTTRRLNMQPWVKQLKNTTFKRYSGSLTTPPCSEGVNWFVAADRLSVTVSTYKAARDVMGFNSRFPQSAPGTTNVLSLAAAGLAGVSPAA